MHILFFNPESVQMGLEVFNSDVLKKKLMSCLRFKLEAWGQ
jgi:hypothetical protein